MLSRILATTLGLVLGAAAGVSCASGAPSEGDKLFALHVQPVLAEKCLACHSPDPDKKLKGDLDLSSRESMLRGGESGTASVFPGNAAESLLSLAVSWEDPDFQMPPKEADRLTEAQTWQLRDWINAGAPWPEAAAVARIQDQFAGGLQVATSGGLSEEWTDRRYQEEDVWAYQPVRKPEIPAGFDGNPIDDFIDKKRAAAGLAPAPPADPATWLRRVSFGLTGLPPLPGEVAPSRPEERVATIEHLLASHHYGEHWGRRWLDVVRYADSSGLANDYPRPNAWRYRDYVIRSFNQDKPYDHFVREQIAGDEIDPQSPEMLVATGFLRMGAWEHTAMSVARITRQQFLDDVTDIVGQTFLAHALQCARCHDHKFDPVPTRDFYAIQAVFSTTQFSDRDAPFAEYENRNRFDEERAAIGERIASTNRIRKNLPADEKDQNLGREKAARKAIEHFRQGLDAFEPIAFSVYSGKSRAVSSNKGRIEMPEDPMAGGSFDPLVIRTGGDPFATGPAVQPCTLSAAVPLAAEIPGDPAGRRRAFAEWVASPDNPLTARVMANRIWAGHFGRGIAGNPNSFGATGKKPTHPELLDFLASYLVESGWSVKEMHRLILTSDTYLRSSRHPDPAALAATDPNNALYAAFLPRRLDAEELRDSMLAISGELNRELGGLPARPEINLEAALQPRHIMGGFAPAYQPMATPDARNRRSVYALKIRGLRDPFMEVFNQPSPEFSCEGREASIVTPQAFSLFNGRPTYARAAAMADRIARETRSPEAAVGLAFRRAFGRSPTAPEREDALAHLATMRDHHAHHPIPAPTYPTEITRSAFE
ncbi:PSD1 and planctomycete cytochrome C domain-containing protein [soil metagenome]